VWTMQTLAERHKELYLTSESVNVQQKCLWKLGYLVYLQYLGT
jgi:hypothetical protein